MEFPTVAPVRQLYSEDSIKDPREETRSQLRSLPLSETIHPGMRVAVAVGSRGISCIADVVFAILDEVRECGGQPFLVPAMGSHGGGTAEGQQEVLEGYGLAEKQTGAPICSTMEVIQVGEAPSAMPVYVNTAVTEADAIIVTNRIKPHTGFRNRWESGLMKICAVGLGKRKGAATIHAWDVRDAMPAAARVVIETQPVVAGVAIVENGSHQPVRIAAMSASEIEEQEPALLKLAWRHILTIPFDPLDMLVLGEMGKDISGTGMDTNVIGMWRRIGGEMRPDYRVITALDLTDNSHGNAVGIGYCDLIPQRLRDKVDLNATYTNCLTARAYSSAKIPITLPTDRDVIQTGLPDRKPSEVRLTFARNTLDLHTLWVSSALLPEVDESQMLEQIGAPRELEFSEAGELLMDW